MIICSKIFFLQSSRIYKLLYVKFNLWLDIFIFLLHRTENQFLIKNNFLILCERIIQKLFLIFIFKIIYFLFSQKSHLAEQKFNKKYG
jgi:hypothetical protein